MGNCVWAFFWHTHIYSPYLPKYMGAQRDYVFQTSTPVSQAPLCVAMCPSFQQGSVGKSEIVQGTGPDKTFPDLCCSLSLLLSNPLYLPFSFHKCRTSIKAQRLSLPTPTPFSLYHPQAFSAISLSLLHFHLLLGVWCSENLNGHSQWIFNWAIIIISFIILI